jgi:polyhydroxybutyrate depolymerase
VFPSKKGTVVRRGFRIAFALVIVVAIGLGGAYAYYGYAPSPKVPVLTGDVRREKMEVDGRVRNYLVYTPVGLEKDAPLIVVLHGTAMNPDIMREWTGYEFDKLADAKHFAVAYPEAFEGSWNDCRKGGNGTAKRENINDTGFIKALIARLHDQSGIDPNKVYAMGYSYGGQMATRLGLETPRVVAGVVAVAANLREADDSVCAQVGPTPPFMLIAGTDDPIEPFAGGDVTIFGLINRGKVQSAEATAYTFAKRNNLTDAPIRAFSQANPANGSLPVASLTWLKNGLPYIVWYTVSGGGHVIPQPTFRYPRLLGATSSVPDVPAETIKFFSL